MGNTKSSALVLIFVCFRMAAGENLLLEMRFKLKRRNQSLLLLERYGVQYCFFCSYIIFLKMNNSVTFSDSRVITNPFDFLYKMHKDIQVYHEGK